MGVDAMDLLDLELRTYDAKREGLLASAEGSFVLIRGEEVVGTYDSAGDAVRQGYQQFGNVPFLVKQVLRVETPQDFVSNLLAI